MLPQNYLALNFKLFYIHTVSPMVSGCCSFERFKFKTWRFPYPYPQNHAWNLARENAQTKYILTLDVDLMPCPEMAKDLSKFLRTNSCDNCAFALVTYEIQNDARFPMNKPELMDLVEAGKARQYHLMISTANQAAINIKRFSYSAFFFMHWLLPQWSVLQIWKWRWEQRHCDPCFSLSRI